MSGLVFSVDKNMQNKPQLNFWQIWNMCFGFLGIQFGFALQNANVSRIFQTLGASIDDIPILWIAAPITGLVVQPIVGYLSDNTWGRLGRRRPYFLYGAIATSAALCFMPHSPTLWIAAGMLWIMDASINVSMEPFRALVGDNLPKNQQPKGYLVQSFFIGVGAIVASALPWVFTNILNVSNTAEAGQIPDSVTYAFYAGAVILFLAVGWSIIKTKEYSPEELASFDEHNTITNTESVIASQFNTQKCNRYAVITALAGAVILSAVIYFELDQQLYILAGLLAVAAIMLLSIPFLHNKGRVENGYYKVAVDFFNLPKTMRQLAPVQFCSWFALFAMWIYTTSAVTSHHYGSSDTTSVAYNTGADWVGILFAAYNGFAALAALVIPVLVNKLGVKKAHLLNMALGGLGLASMTMINDPAYLLLSMVGVGFAWASILSLPYAMLASSLPSHKMGVYMGIFNFFIVIPQILAATLLGFIVNTFFGGEAIYALVTGGVLMVAAGLLTLRVSTD